MFDMKALLRATSRTARVKACTRSPARSSLGQIQGRAHSSYGISCTSPSRPSLLSTCSKRVTKQVHGSIAPQSKHLTTTPTTQKTPVALVNDLPRGFQEVVVDFHDGKATRYPSFWLRDHCPCSDCTHPQTRQRQIDTFSLDPDIKAVEAEPTPDGLKVSWTNSEHISLYPWSWLQKHTPFTPLPSTYNPRGKWQHVSPASPKYPTVDHESVMGSDIGLSTLLSQIRKYGFAFISNTPPTPEATEKLCERIAHIRQTHYGGFWEVISKSDPIDTAYTNLFLPNHTDNTYFTEPCGLQLFHCLSHTPPPPPQPSDSNSNSTSASGSTSTSTSKPQDLGGESTFIDGFAAAQHLHQTDPQSYKLLSQVPVVSHASGSPSTGPIMNNTLSSPGHPVFTHLLPNSPPNPKNLSCIRWNNSDRHSSTSFPSHQTMMSWYEAARKWDAILKDQRFEVVVKLVPGMPVIFDNWRVLHGRRAFVGERRLCGAYISMDDFVARGKRFGWRMEGEDEEEEG